VPPDHVTTTYRVAAGEESRSRGAAFATVADILMGSFAFRFDSPASVDSHQGSQFGPAFLQLQLQLLLAASVSLTLSFKWKSTRRMHKVGQSASNERVSYCCLCCRLL